MSFEHEWPLTVWPKGGEVERAVRETVAAAQLKMPAITYETFDSVKTRRGLPAASPNHQLAPETIISLAFRVPVAAAIDTALRIDPRGSREMYERTINPPLESSNHYTLTIQLVASEDDDPPCVRIHTNEYDNREGFSVLAAIATEFAGRLEKLSAFS